MTVDIANRLVELRKKHGYSQEKLADMLGLSRQAVSKWERAEASPDTDNLIMLSRLYGISLDDLLKTEEEDEAFVKQDMEQEEKEQRKGKSDSYVNIGPRGVHVIDPEKGDEVHVSWKGVQVTEGGHQKVSINKEGVYVDDEGIEHQVGKRGRVVVNGVDYTDGRWKKSFWARLPIAVIILIAIVVISFIQGSLHPAWLLLLAIPVIDSLIKSIYYKDIHRFAFPVVAIAAFLCLGFFYGLWHPGWVVFLTIPIWYSFLPQRKYIVGEDSHKCDSMDCDIDIDFDDDDE